MNLSIKTVCAALFILTVGSTSQAQISLDKFVYQTPGSTDPVEYFFTYENERITTIDVFSVLDTTTLIVEYEDEKYKLIKFSSSKNSSLDYSLSFRYNQEMIDTVYFMNSNWIGLLDINYDSAGKVINKDRFINIEGDLVRNYNEAWEYSGNRLIKKWLTVYETFEPFDFYTKIDYYQYRSIDQVSQIDHHSNSSDIVGLEKFQYYDGDLVFRSEESIPLNENGYINEYAITHYKDYKWDEISHPFNLFETLETLGYSFTIDHLRYSTNAFEHSLVEKIVANSGAEGTFIYSEELVSSIDEDLEIPEDAIIYPNPVVDYLYFTQNFQPELVEIYDLSGALACKMNYVNTNVNLSNLQTGNYILNAVNNKGEMITVQFYKK